MCVPVTLCSIYTQVGCDSTTLGVRPHHTLSSRFLILFGKRNLERPSVVALDPDDPGGSELS